ncbi:hypothetical protein HBH70_244070 [Parastagonospora nodorum]|nr:hypothetical protein HBI03_243280 [Parastagonospora nodorum]KAH4285766.1 hypothetical protein HBI01_247490 [Parastagonospora nodorum]KAH4484519.1 hypothetical protein HBH87_238640 [Parastagonospora nodorum]KAH4565907.1 hypothetical protein HBH83_246220 [Parastagonospora nodorum]KAH4750322.1 hypothetical protein HBH63_244870 [Parastagonospora nodorum]
MRYTLLTLLSASMVAAAPAPFVVSGDVAAIGSATEGLSRREPHDFVKRAFPVRRATVLARGQKDANANAEEDAAAAAAAAEEEAQQQQGDAAAGADEQQAKGKGKGKGKQEAQAGELAEQNVIIVS